MKTSTSKKPSEQTDGFIKAEAVGNRWFCCSATAKRRLKKFGVKPLRLSQRSILYRMSDIERIEADCI
jgi:hypothetical protein